MENTTPKKSIFSKIIKVANSNTVRQLLLLATLMRQIVKAQSKK